MVERLRTIQLLRDPHEGVGKSKSIINHVFDGLIHSVSVHLLEERITSVEHSIKIVNLLGVEANLLVDDATELHQTRGRAIVRQESSGEKWTR